MENYENKEIEEGINVMLLKKIEDIANNVLEKYREQRGYSPEDIEVTVEHYGVGDTAIFVLIKDRENVVASLYIADVVSEEKTSVVLSTYFHAESKHRTSH